MAIPGATSALVAAFSFGIVLNAALAALFLTLRGHGSSVFRDGKRLVLVLFLFSAGLWAQIDFITTLIDTSAAGSCQLGVIFTNIFDQLARYLIEQHVLWVIGAGTATTIAQYFATALLAGRFVLGAVFVGLSKSEFNTVCVSVTSNLIIGVVVVALDAVIVATLLVRAISVGVFTKMQNGGQDSARGKAVTAILIGFSLWTATSVPMLLGIAGGEYLFRSAIPAGGLGVLITIVTAVSDMTPDEKRDRERRIPEAPSPRMMTTSRDITTADSTDYPPSRYEDLKREQVTASTAFIQPREVPLPGQAQGLSNISNPVTGGIPPQGQLFPPMRASADIPRSASVRPTQELKQKKSVFDSSKAPARSITVGKLAISGPVLAEGGSNPLDKVATTDLATAAQMDRERREQLRLLNSSQPGPQMGNNMQTTTIAARAPTSPASEPSLPESATLAVGSASGWQLSPGGKDELRRRSPRRMASNASEKSSTTTSTQMTASTDTSLMSSQAPSLPEKSPARLLAQQGLSGGGANALIRPSRQLAPTPEPVIEPLKTPVQKLAQAGLPLNPRARSVRKKAEELAKQRQETVMFVNSIVYDDPDFVESVLESAKPQPPKTAPLPSTDVASSVASSSIPTTPGTATSVVHRPRPIPRKPQDSDQTFYPPVNQGHRKSRSAGSVLRSMPGSPTQLPPLPPPPMMKPSAYRRQPNDTKSMTFEEKVKYLFPEKSRENERAGRRRSSNPDMPTSFMSDSPTLTDGETLDYHSTDSKNSHSSVRTRSIFDEQDREVQREISMGTYQGLMDNREDLVDENTLGEGTLMSRNTGGKRASSPILPPMGDFKSPMSGMFDEIGTNMDSDIYSPLPIQQVGVTAMPMQARAVEVGRPNNLGVPQPTNRGISTTTTGEEMTFMIDSAVARDARQFSPQAMSPMDTRDAAEDRKSSRSSSGPLQTHHIGDETPSFSILSERRGSRRGPPPTPLVLSERPTSAKQAAMTRAAELSPLPSPGEALKMIQAQLKKYEESDRIGSVESPGRVALLNDLEAEMGMQETRWLGMQNAFSRDSMSTLDISPTSRHASAALGGYASEENSLSRNSSLRSNMSAGIETSRRSRLGSVSSMFSTRLSNGEPGTRATLWQKRLEEAQLEYMENANELNRKRSVNFLTAPKSGGAATPTPPESDESETEIETRKNFANFLKQKARSERSASNSSGLWVPPPKPENREGLMWVRPERPYYVPVVEPPLPGLSVRPAQRKEMSTLPIASSQLWQKPAAKLSNVSGLWKTAAELKELSKPKKISFYNPGIQRSRTNPARPLTQRPPRRSKRITALPDILEDPQPLPNKRDTLGIFQFPWGEKSDTANVPMPASRSFAAMPGTMSTRLDARAQQLEAQEYSSSFFDDYEDDASDNSSDMGSDDDEGFDETTLFEIASLLKSTNVPSTQSFFGPSSSRDVTNDFLDDYMDDQDRYEEARRDDRQTILVGIEEEFEALQEMRPARGTSTLWEIEEEEEGDIKGKGLPQPENWEDDYDKVLETARAKPRLSLQPPTISSDNLWTGSTPKTSSNKSPLWTPLGSPKRESPSVEESPSVMTRSPSTEEQSTSGLSTPEEMTPSATSLPLWIPTEQKTVGDHGVGLPHPADWESYDEVKSTLRAKPRQSVPAVIESVNMWSPSSSDDESPAPLPAPLPAPEIAPKIAAVVPMSASGSMPLWEVTEKRVQGDHGVGLPHPVDWANYDNVQSTVRAKPRQQAEPAVIESANMWSPSASDDESPAPLPVKEIAPKMAAAAVVPISTSGMPLWEETEKRVQGDHGVGLPHPVDWANYDNVQSTVRAKPRQQAEPAVIESVDLWRVAVPEGPSASALTWAPKNKAATPAPVLLPATTFVPAVAQPKQTTSKLLWAAAPQSVEKASVLFDLSAGRTQFRSTEQPPAALHMDHKRSSPELKPLDRLASDALWAVQPAASEERVWIMSKGVSQSKTSKTLWAAPASFEEASDDGLFDPTAKRADFRTTEKAPAALEASRKSRKAEEKALEPLASTNLWTAAPQGQTERNWISSPVASTEVKKTGRKTLPFPKEAWEAALLEAVNASYPPRAQRKTPVATPEQWKVALEQAVAASYPPRTRAARKAPIEATAADWAAALAEAVKQSTRPLPRASAFDAARRHPVFAEAMSLTSKASITHPAATGYVHDVTKIHPVFLASCLTTKADVTHPAATGYTYDVAVYHPVFFGSGAGEIVHPAMPSTSEPDASDAWLLAAKVEIAAKESQLSTIQRNVSQRGKGSRISKMLSRFQQDGGNEAPVSRSASPSRSRSIIRDQAAELNRRVRSTSRGAPVELERGRRLQEEIQPVPAVPVTAPVAVSAPVEAAPVEKVEAVAAPAVEATIDPAVEPIAEPVVEFVAEPIVEPVVETIVEPVAVPVAEPVVEPVVEYIEPVVEEAPAAAVPEFFLPASTYQRESRLPPAPTYQDPAIMAQIEALEKERLFAQQWAASASVEPAPPADETIFGPSTPPSEQEEYDFPVYSYNAEELFTPTFSQTARESTAAAPQEQQRPQTSIVPERASWFNFATSPTSTRPGRILSIITSEPLFEAIPSPSTYSAVSRNYNSSSSSNGQAEAAAAALVTPIESASSSSRWPPAVAQLRREDSVRSVVSPLSETEDRTAFRDSLVSVESGRGGQQQGPKRKGGNGSRVSFLRYGETE